MANADEALFCKNCGAKLEPPKTNKKTDDTKGKTNNNHDSAMRYLVGGVLAFILIAISLNRWNNTNTSEDEIYTTKMYETEANATEANATEANATEANATAPAAEANTTAADGAAAYAACGACHGADGKTAALGKSAVIAGQSAADIESKLKEYKAGTRDVTGNGALMKGQVATLSDDQIKALAIYINSLDPYSSGNMQSYKNAAQDQVYHQNNFFTQNNVKNFLESHLQSNCFKSVYDVSYFFSKNIYKYYNFTNPTLQMLLDDNIKYCAKWDKTEYKLNTFNILNQGFRNGNIYADVVENVSYSATNSKKKIIGTIDLFLTLINENGQIKIISIYSKNNQKTTYAAVQKDMYPDDYLKPNAYKFITGKDLINFNDIVVKYNSKGIKIYCLSNMSICKTENEVTEYLNGRNANINRKKLTKDECRTLLGATFFNRVLEDVCKFNGNVGKKIGLAYIYGRCSEVITEREMSLLGSDVNFYSASDIQRMGLDNFCQQNKKPYYDLSRN
jgi:cytochrome c553